MPTGPNAAFVRHMNDIGFAAFNVGSAGTALNKLGVDVTCAVSTNDYQVTFPGWRNNIPTVIVTSKENSAIVEVSSKSTTTCTITGRTALLTGGTGTNADFAVLIMGRASM